MAQDGAFDEDWFELFGARGDDGSRGEGKVGEMSLADVSRGKKIGRGSFGDVYEGSVGSRRVVLKESRGGGGEFF